MKPPFGYCGTVRAKEHCTYAGVRYNGGDVFEVHHHCLTPHDPFVPVRVIGWDDTHVQAQPKRVPVCKVLTEDLHSLNRRGGA